jgi:hypothetical protein
MRWAAEQAPHTANTAAIFNVGNLLRVLITGSGVVG